jgi:hypothetical protein
MAKDYEQVPSEEAIEMKAFDSPPPKQEAPASKSLIIFSVVFYLVAAIVVSCFFSPTFLPMIKGR